MGESLVRQCEGRLGGLQHFAPARVHDDPVEIAQHQAMAGEKMIHRRSQLLARALRDVRAEDDAEAVVLDGPAHHVFAPPPHVFTGRDKTGQSFASGRATQEQRSGAVAEQRGGDEVLDAVVGVAAIDGAQLDHEEQHIAPGQRLRHPRRARKAAHAPRAAKAKNGQPLDRGRKAQTIGQDCIETWDGKPRGGHRHDGFDFIQIDAGQ